MDPIAEEEDDGSEAEVDDAVEDDEDAVDAFLPPKVAPNGSFIDLAEIAADDDVEEVDAKAGMAALAASELCTDRMISCTN
jgi:hypothetical protein